MYGMFNTWTPCTNHPNVQSHGPGGVNALEVGLHLPGRKPISAPSFVAALVLVGFSGRPWTSPDGTRSHQPPGFAWSDVFFPGFSPWMSTEI